MKHLAKIGFSQSYTYFTWRVEPREIEEYATELHDPELSCYFRPNFWPNTPDILSGPLRRGTRADFAIRYVLAATLSPSYGIYGPAFELGANQPRDEKSEEYLDSEKYELKAWRLDDPASLAPLVRRVNEIRRAASPWKAGGAPRFHPTTNESLLAYSYRLADEDKILLVVVNLDSKRTQAGMLSLPVPEHGWDETESFPIRDLLDGAEYAWKGDEHYIELNPEKACAHLFLIARKPAPAEEPEGREPHE